MVIRADILESCDDILAYSHESVGGVLLVLCGRKGFVAKLTNVLVYCLDSDLKRGIHRLLLYRRDIYHIGQKYGVGQNERDLLHLLVGIMLAVKLEYMREFLEELVVERTCAIALRVVSDRLLVLGIGRVKMYYLVVDIYSYNV